MYDVCNKKAWSLEFVGGSSTKISPAFELRNPGVPAVVRSFQLPCMKFRQTSLRLYQIKQVTAYH
jgi:hypothetical protein